MRAIFVCNITSPTKGPDVNESVGGGHKENRQRQQRRPAGRDRLSSARPPASRRPTVPQPRPPLDRHTPRPAEPATAARSPWAPMRQPQHQPQQGRIPKSPLLNHAQRGPDDGQRQQHGKRLGPVEVAVLDVNHRQSSQPGGQKPHVAPVQPTPQHEDPSTPTRRRPGRTRVRPTYLISSPPMSVNSSTTDRKNTRTYIRMLPSGNQ